MKSVVAVVAVLCALAAISVQPVRGTTDHIWISNQSKRDIRATTFYPLVGSSQFQDRLIKSQDSDSDEYDDFACQNAVYHLVYNPIGVTLWVDGAPYQSDVYVGCDVSIVGVDNINATGVAIYQSVYGDINTPTGDYLALIYP